MMFQRRIMFLAACFTLGFLAVIARLVFLQILHADDYRNQREERRHRLAQIPPIRGKILDRLGRVLAEDRPSFDLWLIPAKMHRKRGKSELVGLIDALLPARILQITSSRGEQRELEEKLTLRDIRDSSLMAEKLAKLLKRDKAEIAEILLHAATSRHARSELALTYPRPFMEDIGLKAFQEISRAILDPGNHLFNSLEPRVGTQRVYPTGEDMGHITGYVGKLTQKEYRILRGYWEDGHIVEGKGHIGDFFKLDEEGVEMSIIRPRESRRNGRTIHSAGYFSKEEVGRYGVEKTYNQILRGYHTRRYLRLERPVPGGPRMLVKKGLAAPTRNGKDIALTIDLDMQRKIRKIMQEELGFLERDKARPFQGACVLMDCQTGEIHAMVSEPGFDPNTLGKDFPDLIKDPRHPLLNHAIAGAYPPGSVMKPVTAIAALEEGKITPETEFLCEGVLKLGRHNFVCMHRHVHGHVNVVKALKKSCNIFFYHTGGVLGSRKLYDWSWSLGLGHRTGIDLAGESPGHLPMKAYTRRGWALGNTYHISIGQGPITLTPIQLAVAYSAIANGGNVVQPHVRLDDRLNEPRGALAINPESIATVKQGMWEVVQGQGGTAPKARVPGMDIGGKTGTAQWKKRKPDHAWFACFAPFEAPEVVCVVLVPKGELGGTACGPIARRILMAFFNIKEEESSLG